MARVLSGGSERVKQTRIKRIVVATHCLPVDSWPAGTLIGGKIGATPKERRALHSALFPVWRQSFLEAAADPNTLVIFTYSRLRRRGTPRFDARVASLMNLAKASPGRRVLFLRRFPSLGHAARYAKQDARNTREFTARYKDYEARYARRVKAMLAARNIVVSKNAAVEGWGFATGICVPKVVRDVSRIFRIPLKHCSIIVNKSIGQAVRPPWSKIKWV